MSEFKPKTPGNWGVKDTLARDRARIHEPAPGATYALKADAWTEMPAAHAAKFLSDRAFVVVDEEGQQRVTLPKAAVATPGYEPPKLGPGEVIAGLDELETKALLARAVRRSGGEKFTRNTKRDTLMRFLLDTPDASRRDEEPAAAKPEAGADDGIEMDPEGDPDVDQLFAQAGE